MSSLSDDMEFGRVVSVDPSGEVIIPDPRNFYDVPEVVYFVGIDNDLEEIPDGWVALTGFTGQHGYNGPVMHPSEFIGGGLERHILSTPGLYCAVMVDDIDTEDGDDPSIGWAILYQEI